MDGLFEGHPTALADDLAEEEGEGAVEAGMGLTFDVEAVADDRAEGVGEQLLQVFVALVEGQDIDVALLGAEEGENGVDGMFSEGFADGGEVGADEVFTDGGADGGDKDVAPLLGGLLNHGGLHVEAEGRVGEASKECGGAAVEGPSGEELSQYGTTGKVWVAIEGDVDAFVAGGFEFFESLGLLGPVATPYGLEVGNLEAAAGRPREVKLLVERRQKVIAVAAHVGRVDFSGAGDDAAEGDEFFSRGGGAGGVHEAGGEAGGPAREALGEALLHGVEFGCGGRALAGAHGGDAEGAMADEGVDGDEFGFGFGFGEVFPGVSPGPVAMEAEENAVGKLLHFVAVGSARIGGKAAIPYNFGGHALVGFGAVAGEDLKVRVAVDVDEAGGDDEAGAIEL